MAPVLKADVVYGYRGFESLLILDCRLVYEGVVNALKVFHFSYKAKLKSEEFKKKLLEKQLERLENNNKIYWFRYLVFLYGRFNFLFR